MLIILLTIKNSSKAMSEIMSTYLMTTKIPATQLQLLHTSILYSHTTDGENEILKTANARRTREEKLIKLIKQWMKHYWQD